MNDSHTKSSPNSKLLFLIGIPMVLLLIALRFVIYYFKTNGFSGISNALPVLFIGFILFALLSAGFFAAWVYKDCQKRQEDGLLWALLIFIVTPLLGLLLYFLRRSEIKMPCPACGHLISKNANYCEACGSHTAPKEGQIIMEKQHTLYITYIIAGMISLALMLTCLTGFVLTAATAGNVNTSVSSADKIWNFGSIRMGHNTYWDGVWRLSFQSASDGFVSEEELQIPDAAASLLYADISCANVPEGASLTLWLVQGEVSRSIDVTALTEPLEYPLHGFENGPLYVRLQINGVKDVTSEIFIH